MSTPIRYCQLVKACDDPEYFAKFHPVMKRNMDGGHWSVYPCSHDTRCRQLSVEEQQQLMIRFKQPPLSSVFRNEMAEE